MYAIQAADSDPASGRNESGRLMSETMILVSAWPGATLRPAAAIPLVIGAVVRSTNTTGCLNDYKGDRRMNQECSLRSGRMEMPLY